MLLESPIITPRLELKTLDATNMSPHYLSWLQDTEVTQYLEIRHAPPLSNEALLASVDKVNADPHSLLLGIFLKDADKHIGNIKIGPINAAHKRADIGFLIGEKNCWGQGFGSEAIVALAEYAGTGLGLEKLTAGCYEQNIGSAKVLTKAGFVNDARLPRHAIFGGKRVDVFLFGRFKQ
jgi:ribosomal-protein-alanine N-acetyltransferase